MEFSKEEKKAIEFFKSHVMPYENKKGNIEFLLNEVIVKLIDKLQGEIEDLKAITQNYNAIGGETFGDDRIIVCSVKYFDDGYFKKNYIFKDKIREKIKELETLYNCNLDTAMTSYEMFCFVRSYIDKVKNILDELLEEK